MRVRLGNFTDEGHGKPLRHYEFVADGTKSATDVLVAIEAATGLRLRSDPLGQHGHLLTSPRPDGSLWLAVVLYEACADTASCVAGHRGVPLLRAADIPPAIHHVIKVAVGESPKHQLGTDNDRNVLSALGWAEDDQGRKRPL